MSRTWGGETSIEQIAAAAGFSKDAVYSNFTSKDELFMALMDQQVRSQFAGHRGRARQLVADAVRDILGADAEAAGIDTDALATTILALSNGLAIDRPTDPDAVSSDLFGRLLRNLLSPSAV